MPLTTVTTVVGPISSVPVGETELEVGSKSVAEVEGVGEFEVILLEKVEVFEVVGMGVGEDDEDGEDVNADNAGVVLVGVAVDDSSVVGGTDDDIVLVFVINNVVCREHKHIPNS